LSEAPSHGLPISGTPGLDGRARYAALTAELRERDGRVNDVARDEMGEMMVAS
jgi:hypothetical protein